ncbi:MAG: TetR/AcrR family transcriptional regulator [Sphingomonadales bacterium]|nr:TetR/AcrR family transcriptional regulator [Sphingomonadales bacterium]
MKDPHKSLLSRIRELLFLYGIKSITLDDIASRIGISKKTIYNWHPDKKHLVDRIVQDYLSAHRDDAERVRSEARHAIDQVLQMAQLARARMEQVSPAFLFDLNKSYPEIWARFEHYRTHEIFAQVVDVIRRGQQEGLFRANLDIEIVATMHLQHIRLLTEPGQQPRLERPVADLIRNIISVFLHGIVTRKGLDVMAQMEKEMN